LLLLLDAGQGLLPAQSSTVGATSTLSQLQALYSSSQAWRRKYQQHPSAACSRASRASLCAAAATDAVDAYAQLVLATSPQVYSSTGDSKVRLVSPAQDQGPCQSCAAFAVAAAAETAMASALQVDVQQCSISVQSLYFCPQGKPSRSCSAGWSLAGALEQLQLQVQSIPTTKCLPYRPDFRQQLTTNQLCARNCEDTSQHSGGGQLSATQITSMWEAQQHIRRHGAVVSRFDVRWLIEADACMHGANAAALLTQCNPISLKAAAPATTCFKFLTSPTNCWGCLMQERTAYVTTVLRCVQMPNKSNRKPILVQVCRSAVAREGIYTRTHHARPFHPCMQVFSDLKRFFADKRNAKAVYSPGAASQFLFAHAIMLVGYNNQQQYWLAKNSWGTGWADSGLFKVTVHRYV
jgi:hypothetical protein